MSVTVSSAYLGRRLAALRERAGLTSSEVAARMEYSRAKLSRQEHGTHVVSVSELERLITNIYGAGDAELTELEALRAQATKGPGWWHESGGDIPLHLKTYYELEAKARKVFTFGIEVIPGLFQTVEYSLHQAAIFGRSSEAAERTAETRQRRKRLLVEGTEADVIVAESALRRCAASGLRGQLADLMDQASLPTVHIQVLPDSAGIHGVTGSYSVLELPPGTLNPVMYLEYPGGSILVEDQDAVAETIRQHQKISRLAHRSLGADGTVFLKHLISELG